MYQSLIIVDDFIDNPDGLREAAKQLTFPEQQGAFPGRNSLQRIQMEGLDQQVSRLVGEPIEPIDPLQSHAKCRLTLAGDKGLAGVHTDQSHWSGILYLTRPEHCSGGTDFFQHRRTGTDRAPFNDAELHALGYSSHEEMHDKIIAADSTNPDKWKRIMRVPMRFNRLILLRPWLWHTAGPGFGDSIDNGRLVYLMFFRSAQQ